MVVIISYYPKGCGVEDLHRHTKIANSGYIKGAHFIYFGVTSQRHWVEVIGGSTDTVELG